MRDPDTGEERFARVKVPEAPAALLDLGARGLRIPLERVIAHFLSELFPQMEIVERAAFRVTRDADFEVSDEADDLLEAVELELRRRRFGDVVRLEVSVAMSTAMLDAAEGRARRRRGAACTSVRPARPRRALQLVRLDRPDLADEPGSA